LEDWRTPPPALKNYAGGFDRLGNASRYAKVIFYNKVGSTFASLVVQRNHMFKGNDGD